MWFLKNVIISIIAMAGERRQSQRQRLESRTSVRVCNFFQRPFGDALSLSNYVVNGLRMPSEATMPRLALKYCKIGRGGIYAPFPTGKPETSDFFRQKYGCFTSKVRMFVSKKSDVFRPKRGIF